MSFNMKGMFSGAVSGAGTGAAVGGGWGALIGGVVGGVAGGFMQGEEPSVDQSAYRATPEETAYMNDLRGIANGTQLSPAEMQLQSQANRSFAQQVGAMSVNRGASAGAKQAFLQNQKMQNDAILNEKAAQMRAQETMNARGDLASFSGSLANRNMDLAKLNLQREQAQQDQNSNVLGKALQLGAWGASQYMNSGAGGATKGFTSSADTPYAQSNFVNAVSGPSSAALNPYGQQQTSNPFSMSSDMQLQGYQPSPQMQYGNFFDYNQGVAQNGQRSMFNRMG